MVGVRDKQVNLEDIENENVANERTSHQIPRPSPKEQQVPPNQYVSPQPTTPEVQYGFKPMKMQPQYVQQHQYLPQQQYALQPQYFTYQQPQTPAHYTRIQHYLQQPEPSQYQRLQPPQPSYITDNQLGQESYQQYYTPQYVYLQQYPSASTSIQTVVDPKGGVQYVMYLHPQYIQSNKIQETQGIEALLQPQNQIYESQGKQEQEIQYVEIQPQAQVEPQIQYVRPPPLARKIPKYNFENPKYEPKSLLDSYVPSLLQVQYFKQEQQARSNALRQTPQKLKNFNIPQASTQNLRYEAYTPLTIKH